ncbi:MAG: hypothetical protein AAGG06_15760 [Pseudomonadota bacterium]
MGGRGIRIHTRANTHEVFGTDRVIGALLYGDTADGNGFFGRLKDETVLRMRDILIFSAAYAAGRPSAAAISAGWR